MYIHTNKLSFKGLCSHGYSKSASWLLGQIIYCVYMVVFILSTRMKFDID